MTAQAQLRARELIGHLFAPVDIASLVLFRIMFGAIMLWGVWRYFDHGWISRYYIEPVFHFKYYSFGWVEAWPGNGMYWHFTAMGLLAVFMLVGFLYRLSAALFFLAFTYVYLLDQARHLNHYYLVALISFLMIFVPAHRTLSVDAWLRPGIRRETTAAWSLWILRAQMAVVYFYAGLAKLNADWLRGEPMRDWLNNRSDYVWLWDSFPIGRIMFSQEWGVWFFAYGGLLFDLMVVPLLLWRRTRVVAVSVAVFFHLLNSRLFGIGIFPWLAIAATMLFFDPSWPRRIRLSFLPLPAERERTAGPSILGRGQGVTVGLLGLYMAVQLLVPLRHFLYHGSVHWTEEGHRFAWHMKLRDKEGQTEFLATDPQTGRTWEVPIRQYLTSRQRRKMTGRPDMILQFAHFLAQELRGEGYEYVEIRVEASISLNGRKRQLMIDPNVDLAAQRRSLRHMAWIRPLTEPLRSE